MQKVVVTGAAGHVGGNLVRELIRRGIRPRIMVRNDRRAVEGLGLEEVHGDVRDLASLERAFEGADLVYHLAAQISITSDDADLVRATNVEGVRNVIAACRKQKVGRLLHMSSIHAYSSVPRDRPIDEDRPLCSGAHLPPYDLAKAAGETEVRRAASEGLDAVIVNPTGIVGPFDFRPSRMGQVFKYLYQRKLPGLVQGTFDWVDVRDVALGAIAAAEKGKRGDRFLLSGHRRTVVELGGIVEKVTGKRPPIFATPMWLARGVAPFATAYARVTHTMPLFTRESLHALRNHLDVSHARAERELGYHPRPLEDTVRDTFAWFRDAGVL